MKTIKGINEKNLKINCIVFDLDDILLNGAVERKINSAIVSELLGILSSLEKSFSSFALAVVSGYSEEQGKKKLGESGFEKFFKPENVFFVNKEYLDSMQQVDRARYLQNIEKDSFFQDDFFKQKALEKLVLQLGIEKNRLLFVGHDLLTDAYYTQRFSKVPFVLVKSALSLRHVPANAIVSGLVFVGLDWKNFKKLLLGKFPAQDYSFLQRFIENYLAKELVGNLQVKAGFLGKARIAEKGKTA